MSKFLDDVKSAKAKQKKSVLHGLHATWGAQSQSTYFQSHKSEFELTSLMQYSPIMRQLYESKNEYDQKVIAQIVKMNAVLSMVTGRRGGYQRMAGLPSTH